MRTARVTDAELLAILRGMPRSTTSQIAGALAEDLGAYPSDAVLRTQLNRLNDAGRIARSDRDRTDHGHHYSWWVPD